MRQIKDATTPQDLYGSATTEVPIGPREGLKTRGPSLSMCNIAHRGRHQHRFGHGWVVAAPPGNGGHAAVGIFTWKLGMFGWKWQRQQLEPHRLDTAEKWGFGCACDEGYRAPPPPSPFLLFELRSSNSCNIVTRTLFLTFLCALESCSQDALNPFFLVLFGAIATTL